MENIKKQLSNKNNDIRFVSFKTCFLEYLIVFLSLTTEAIHIHNTNKWQQSKNKNEKQNIKNNNNNNSHQTYIEDTFFKKIKIYFKDVNTQKTQLNIIIERDGQYNIEYIVYILLAIDIFISTLSNKDTDNSKILKIDVSNINKDFCKKKSLYEISMVLFKNIIHGITPFTFFFTSYDKNRTECNFEDLKSFFFTTDELKKISKRLNISRSNERIKIMLSKYKKKIKDDFVQSNNNTTELYSKINTLLYFGKDEYNYMDIIVRISDKKSYHTLKNVEKRTKLLNKSITDYLEALIEHENIISMPDKLKVMEMVFSFRKNLFLITESLFPILKFNASRKNTTIHQTIQMLYNNSIDSSNDSSSNNNNDNNNNANNNDNDNNIDNKKNNNINNNTNNNKNNNNTNNKSFLPFTNYITSILSYETIINLWLNRIFLTSSHRNTIDKYDIQKTNILSLLIHKEYPKGKILKVFNNVCSNLRNSRLPVSLHMNIGFDNIANEIDQQPPLKQQKIKHQYFDPIDDIQILQSLPKGKIDTTELFFELNSNITGNYLINSSIDTEILKISNGDIQLFSRCFTDIGQNLLNDFTSISRKKSFFPHNTKHYKIKKEINSNTNINNLNL
uniref:Uncharacterized protein n=1 Tax=Metapenaeus joyneri majanivirus TaxID=2984280 RepID=A0A9C7BQV8_9VIRU|nr:MAG: hypothetical protein [Metapenaeus joyneri majanivirus]